MTTTCLKANGMWTETRRAICSSCRLFKAGDPVKLKGVTTSSQEWLRRQMKDPYVEKARMENYRCRSAFKILEINEKFKILRPGQVVVECGAAPGSWTQVAVSKTNASGKDPSQPRGSVIALDRLSFSPVEGATTLGGCDFTLPESRDRLKAALDGRLADVVLSDMAPNSTGIKSLDHEAIVCLAYLFVRFALEISQTGSSLLVKILTGCLEQKFKLDVGRFYDTVKWVKPLSSRSDSSEIFLLARNLKPR